jgi:uncharacterized protein YgiM (DUF1202 family)
MADSSARDSMAAPADTGSGGQAQPSLLPDSDQLQTDHGYNLKVNVRMAPVYADSTLVSEITGYLPRGSVVGVLSVLDNWYKIEYGEQNDRRQGWVISYGVERTHEMEHVVTSRDDENRWAGMRVVVVAGETSVRSFPSTAADVLVKAYRNEIFEVAGASEDYYMVRLSDAVNGWIWRGDVANYEDPKYTREQIEQMYSSIRDHRQRISDLKSLVSDLESRDSSVQRNLELLSVLDQRRQEQAARLAARGDSKPFFQFDSLKQRLSLQAGFLRQGFDGGLGLDVTMLMGLGMRYRPSDKLSFELSRHGGDPALLAAADGTSPLPSGLSGLDSLTVSAKFWQMGMRYELGKLRRLPLLGKLDNHLYAGLGFLTLSPKTAGYSGSQNLWGPVLGWGFKMRLFGPLSLDASLRAFLTQAEVTDVRFAGMNLLQTKSVFLKNIGFTGGISWQF